MLELELVLPCYNESKSLEALIRRASLAAQSAGFSSERFQLVLVENGSKDDSSLVMDSLKQGPLGAWFRKVQVEVNQGYGFGLCAGLTTTTAPYVAWSHADQQCDPADVLRGFEVLKASPPRTLVKGIRHGRAIQERAVSRVFEILARIILGLRVSEINAQPKVFGRALLTEIEAPPPTFSFDLYVLYRAQRAGYQVKTIDVKFPPRVHGVSNWANSLWNRQRTIAGMVRYMWELARADGKL